MSAIAAGTVPALATPDPSPARNTVDLSPSELAAQGPEKDVRGGHRPESGKNLKAGPLDNTGAVAQTTVKLSNTVTDKDGDRATLSFQVYETDGNGKPTTQVKLSDKPGGVLVSPYTDSGKTAAVEVPYGKLNPGKSYAFRTSGFDGTLYETSWSSWGTFKVRDRAVDIRLPEPDQNAPKVNLEDYQEPQLARRNIPQPSLLKKADRCTPAGEFRVMCAGVMDPGEISAEKWARAEQRLGDTKALTPLVKWCTDGTEATSGKDSFKRTSACLKKHSPVGIRLVDYSSGRPVPVGLAAFASDIQIQLDPKTDTFQQRLTLVPIELTTKDPKATHITIDPEFVCEPQCTTGAPQWEGSPTWSFTGSDLHSAYATFTHKASGTDTNKTASHALTWGLKPKVPGFKEIDPVQFGNSIPDLDVRCDKVAKPTPGCVFDKYKPTWVMNFKKAPAAVAHAWLIQSKLPTHPGSKAANFPMQYLPDAAKNDAGYDPQRNRDRICPKVGNESWADAKGNPDASPVDASDKLSCDEFAYAKSYNSAGMQSSDGGLNPVNSGDQCVQTYSTRVKQGEWHLYDDTRQAAPSWKERCGRSAMSLRVNSGSMNTFGSTFSGAYRLLDKDEYWVAFPGFEHCDASKAHVKCTVPK
ncbi:hypothetical protein AABB02_40400 [Streptomyces rimosus]|uniref:hypothetical protein n=1 Tax=Streptomyces rimosus TaxID=1927 RepID=UPI0031D8EF5C